MKGKRRYKREQCFVCLLSLWNPIKSLLGWKGLGEGYRGVTEDKGKRAKGNPEMHWLQSTRGLAGGAEGGAPGRR